MRSSDAVNLDRKSLFALWVHGIPRCLVTEPQVEINSFPKRLPKQGQIGSANDGLLFRQSGCSPRADFVVELPVNRKTTLRSSVQPPFDSFLRVTVPITQFRNFRNGRAREPFNYLCGLSVFVSGDTRASHHIV